VGRENNEHKKVICGLAPHITFSHFALTSMDVSAFEYVLCMKLLDVQLELDCNILQCFFGVILIGKPFVTKFFYVNLNGKF